MADNNAVVYSLGFVESWIEKAADNIAKDLTVSNTEAALGHLKIVEEAFHEYRRTVDTMRAVLQDLKRRVDTGAQL
jgi:sulfur relay (sulfurtransferase) DsrC/TusE family protein